MTASFILYQREGCHLCEDMLDELNLLRGSSHNYLFKLKTINIDSSPTIQEQYGLKIPVLNQLDRKSNLEVEICHYYFDKNKFINSL